MSQQPSDEPSDQQPSPFPQYPQQQYPAAPPLGGEYGGGTTPGYPGGGYGDPGQYGPPRTSKLAITSLILGILSLPLLLIGVGPLFALVGLILGIIGIAGARRKNLKRGIGIAGIVISLIGLVGGGLLIAAVSNAATSCKSLNHSGNNTAYTNCIKHNLRL